MNNSIDKDIQSQRVEDPENRQGSILEGNLGIKSKNVTASGVNGFTYIRTIPELITQEDIVTGKGFPVITSKEFHSLRKNSGNF